MNDWFLYGFMAIILAASSYMLFTRNIMHAALALALVLISLAGIYVLFGAEFVAVSQLMVYVGGIIILILFAIMLTNKRERKNLNTRVSGSVVAFIIAGIFFYSFVQILWDFPVMATANAPHNQIQLLGIELLTTYLVPLELVAILLLVILIGAAGIAAGFYANTKPEA